MALGRSGSNKRIVCWVLFRSTVYGTVLSTVRACKCCTVPRYSCTYEGTYVWVAGRDGNSSVAIPDARVKEARRLSRLGLRLGEDLHRRSCSYAPVHTIAGISLSRGPTQPPQARVAIGRRRRKAGDTHARRSSPAGGRPHAAAPAVSGDFNRVRSTLSNL